jgi:hypothetical protein
MAKEAVNRVKIELELGQKYLSTIHHTEDYYTEYIINSTNNIKSSKSIKIDKRSK